MKRETLSSMCFTTLGDPCIRVFFPYVANSGLEWSNEALATLALGYCFRAVISGERKSKRSAVSAK